MSKEEADELYEWLEGNLDWKQREGVSKNGDTYFEPRKTCWFGKPYTYSSVKWGGNDTWDTELEKLRDRIGTDHPITPGMCLVL